MYDLAKDYLLYFDFSKRVNGWHATIFYWQMKNSLNIKTRFPIRYLKIRVRCGKKKFNKIIKEIIFLGYDDSVWIQEVENG